MDRRNFIKNSAIIGAAAALPRFSYAQVKGNDRIKVALVGCGGRGTGAMCNMIAADNNIQLVAMGDLFEGKADASAKKIYEFAKKTVGENKATDIIDPSKVKKFVGWDNLDQVLAEDVDLVVEQLPRFSARRIMRKSSLPANTHSSKNPAQLTLNKAEKCTHSQRKQKKKVFASYAATSAATITAIKI